MLTTPRLIAIALCAALNFAVGSIVYLDQASDLSQFDRDDPVRLADLSRPQGRVRLLISGRDDQHRLTTCSSIPFLIWFSATELAIALVAAFVIARADEIFRARPLPVFGSATRVVLYGILTGVVAAVVSAPVVAYVFGGVTGSGSAFLVAFFLKAGQHLMAAVLHSGFTAEPIDKTLQVLFAALLFRATPNGFHRHGSRAAAAGPDMTPNGAVVFAVIIVLATMMARVSGLLLTSAH